MASGALGAALRQVGRLFGSGTVAGLTEGQLLERFLRSRDEAAFEALVARHGPMVLGVCRRLLADPNDAEDAFQATFLVLVRRAGSIRDPDRLASWLYGVAHRVAVRARADARRRRAREGGSGAEEMPDARESDGAGLGPVVHEELRQLPEKYRAPVVLCYLEGRTHEEAARLLGWPVGTVKGRLARARDQLRGRLARRGLAVPAALVTATLARDAAAAIPPAKVEAIARAALALASGKAGAAGAVSAAALALAEGVLKTMGQAKLKLLAAGLVAAGLAGGSGAAAYQFGGGGGGFGGGGGGQVGGQPGGTGGPGAQIKVFGQPGSPARSASDAVAEARSKLAKARVSAAQSAYNRAKAHHEKGALSSQELTEALRQLVVAERQARDEATPAERAADLSTFLADLEVYSKSAREGVERARKQVEAGTAPTNTTAEAEIAAAEAELWLAEAKAQQLAGNRIGAQAALVHEDDPDEAKTNAIIEALNQPVSMPFASPTPLDDVIKYIKSATVSKGLPDGIPIYFDPTALDLSQPSNLEVTKDGSEPKPKPPKVRMNLEGVRLRTSLRLLLQQLGLAYNVKEGLLIITQPNSPEMFGGLNNTRPGFGGMGGGMGGAGAGMR